MQPCSRRCFVVRCWRAPSATSSFSAFPPLSPGRAELTQLWVRSVRTEHRAQGEVSLKQVEGRPVMPLLEGSHADPAGVS